MNKEYLGDSVYAEMDVDRVVLTVENGYGPTETIILEPETYAELVAYIERNLLSQ
jgi:hypothetical protein